MHRIEVSTEMLAFVGSGQLGESVRPAGFVALRFDLAGTPCFAIEPDDLDDADIVCFVAPDAPTRHFGPLSAEPGAWHLPGEVRAIALAICDCALPEPARTTWRLGKCIELFCATFAAVAGDDLVPLDGAGALGELDAARIVAARRVIDERWREKLTLDAIARACGLNRAKLTRGFRAMFAMTVADAIAERRLGGARQMLLATDLPVSSIGYACGYRNNASFTRAFSRRFGIAPTRLRLGMAA